MRLIDADALLHRLNYEMCCAEGKYKSAGHGIDIETLFQVAFNSVADAPTILTPERAAELATADADGRLVVLPTQDKWYVVCKIMGKWDIVTYSDKTMLRYKEDLAEVQLGKTTFFCFAEAEAALEQRKVGVKDG